MSVPTGVLRAVDIRPEESGRLGLLSLLAMLSIAEAILIRTFSDAVFLNKFPVAYLPWFFLASAVAFLPTTLLYDRLRRRLPSRVLHTGMLVLFSAISGGSYLVGLDTRGTTFAVVLGLAVVSPLVNVIAWSSILGRLNSRDARRLVPLISAGATLGGIVAGMAAIPFIRLFGVGELLLPIAGCNVLMAVLVAGRGGRPASAGEAGDDRTFTPPPVVRSATAGGEGSGSILGNPLLVLLSLAVLLMSLSTNLVDYAFKAELQQSYQGRLGDMGVFLGYYHSLTNVLILLVQLFFVGRVVRKIGLQAAFALHPAVVLLGLLAFSFVPGLLMVAIWKLADGLFKFTFHGPTLEMALTPVPRQLRDRGRALLKGTMHPLGGFCAGLLLLGLGLIGPQPVELLAPLVAGAGGAWLLVALRLKGRYFDQLRRSLDGEPGEGTVTALVAAGPAAGAGPAAEADPEENRVKTRTGVLRAVDGEVRRLQQAVAAGGVDALEHTRALDRLFELLGYLGDPVLVDLVRRRYQGGNLATRATAIELLEMHLDERRVAEAVALLDTLAPEMVERAARRRQIAPPAEVGLGGRFRSLLQGRRPTPPSGSASGAPPRG